VAATAPNPADPGFCGAPEPCGQGLIMAERAEVIVIGGGQAGLAAGYYLSQARIPFLILDAGARAGDSWRRRWDSLELFTAARYSALPGLPFPGDPEHYPGKDAVADYLENYARTHELPIRHDARVTSLERTDDGYRAATGSGDYEAAQVIISAGAYQQPRIPHLSAKLGSEVTQLHSTGYRNPSQLPTREVLVVGAANSGAQIAEDLAATHRVHLSRGGRIPRMPRRLLGRSLHFWGDHLGLIAAPLDGSWRGRTQRGDLLVGTSLRQLQRRHGVDLRGRTDAARERTVSFEDGTELDVDTVIWATGFRSDYTWIHAAVLDAHGAPIHQRGVTGTPGLFFLGMKNQYSRGSSLIGWVRHDAAFIVEHIRGARVRT
jgi:putative flavoprotein involved in K+ transport